MEHPVSYAENKVNKSASKLFNSKKAIDWDLHGKIEHVVWAKKEFECRDQSPTKAVFLEVLDHQKSDAQKKIQTFRKNDTPVRVRVGP